MNPIPPGSVPPVPNPAPHQPVANQLNHTGQPGGQNIQVAPEKPARWGTIIGSGIVLVIKLIGYVAVSPFLAIYMVAVAAGTGFSGKETKECFYDLLEPLKDEVTNIFLGKMGYQNLEEYEIEMRRHYLEQEKQKKIAQANQNQAQPPAPPPPNPPPPPQAHAQPQPPDAGAPPPYPPPPPPPPPPQNPTL